MAPNLDRAAPLPWQSHLSCPEHPSTSEERFGSAYSDARPLGFGWAAGFLSLFATVLLVAVVIIVWRKLTKNSVVALNRAITILWGLLTAVGLFTAVFAPLP